jgi:hypothetical protein
MNNFADESIKHSETSTKQRPNKPKPTIRIERIPIRSASTKDISDKVDALQRSVARLTALVSQSLEERHYTALREKGGWY